MQVLKCKAFRFIAILALVTGIGAVQAIHFNPASAQTTAYRFSSIDVVGNQRIEPATIRNYTGIQPGKTVTAGQVNAAYQKLIASGLFEEVDVTPRGSRLVVTVKEFPTINRINFERNKRIKDDKLAEIVSSRPRHTYSPAQAEADAAAIVEAYRLAGRYTAEVKPKIIRRSDNRVDLVFEIFEGKVVEVERLGFVGNRSFSDRRLRRVLSTKQAGILRGLVKSDTFIADRIEFDKQVLTDFYQSRGFIDFQVLAVDAEVARERDGFFVTFTVREGQSYSFAKLTTTSDLAEIDPDEFQAVIRIKPGTTYSPSLMETTIERMETLATSKGLNFIRVNPRVTRNDRERTLDIEFVLEKGPRVFVERIDIEGNETTLDSVVRRQFDTVEGDPFNPRQIREASNRINALGFFSKADVEARQGSAEDQVIVDVNVEEQPTGTLSFGLTYGASSGLGGAISLSETNFLGRGQYFKLELGGGTSNRDMAISFAEPAFLDRNLRAGISIYRNTTDQLNAHYDTINAGFTPTLGFPVSKNGRLELRYRRSNDTLSNITGTASPLILADAGTRSTSSIGFTYTYDNRTSGLNPDAGVVFRLSQDFAGLGGTAKYSKTSAMVGARTTAFRDEITLSVELEGGILVDGSGGSHLLDRFFMGQEIMRGYAHNGIGPRDLAVANMDALGGNNYAVARFEAGFPLGLPEEYGLTGGVFYDVGSLWGLDQAGAYNQALTLRHVIGFSVFWKTALGPLRFNFSKVLSGPAYDRPESFSLSIASKF